MSRTALTRQLLTKLPRLATLPKPLNATLPPLLLRYVPVVTSTKAGAKRSILDESKLVQVLPLVGSSSFVMPAIGKTKGNLGRSSRKTRVPSKQAHGRAAVSDLW